LHEIHPTVYILPNKIAENAFDSSAAKAAADWSAMIYVTTVLKAAVC
jgi:hypothetical protein